MADLERLFLAYAAMRSPGSAVGAGTGFPCPEPTSKRYGLQRREVPAFLVKGNRR